MVRLEYLQPVHNETEYNPEDRPFNLETASEISSHLSQASDTVRLEAEIANAVLWLQHHVGAEYFQVLRSPEAGERADIYYDSHWSNRADPQIQGEGAEIPGTQMIFQAPFDQEELPGISQVTVLPEMDDGCYHEPQTPNGGSVIIPIHAPEGRTYIALNSPRDHNELRREFVEDGDKYRVIQIASNALSQAWVRSDMFVKQAEMFKTLDRQQKIGQMQEEIRVIKEGAGYQPIPEKQFQILVAIGKALGVKGIVNHTIKRDQKTIDLHRLHIEDEKWRMAMADSVTHLPEAILHANRGDISYDRIVADNETVFSMLGNNTSVYSMIFEASLSPEDRRFLQSEIHKLEEWMRLEEKNRKSQTVRSIAYAIGEIFSNVGSRKSEANYSSFKEAIEERALRILLERGIGTKLGRIAVLEYVEPEIHEDSTLNGARRKVTHYYEGSQSAKRVNRETIISSLEEVYTVRGNNPYQDGREWELVYDHKNDVSRQIMPVVINHRGDLLVIEVDDPEVELDNITDREMVLIVSHMISMAAFIEDVLEYDEQLRLDAKRALEMGKAGFVLLRMEDKDTSLETEDETAMTENEDSQPFIGIKRIAPFAEGLIGIPKMHLTRNINFLILFHPEDRYRVFDYLSNPQETETPLIVRMVNHNGSYIESMDTVTNPKQAEASQTSYGYVELKAMLADDSTVACTIIDASSVKKTMDAIEEEAHIDQMTGLAGKGYLEKVYGALKSGHLYTPLETSEPIAMPEHVAILTIDLNKFKEANDTYGHDTGDELLITVSKILSSVTQEAGTNCIAARRGGDEFVLVLPGHDSMQASQVAESFKAQMKRHTFTSQSINPQTGEQYVIDLGASIGIAVIDQAAFNQQGSQYVGSMIHFSDLAMYYAKKRMNTSENVRIHVDNTESRSYTQDTEQKEELFMQGSGI